MRDVKIECEEQLGPFKNGRKLKIGDVQHFVFQENDEGPCWMTPAERQETRRDKVCPDGKEDKYIFNKKELQAKLNEKNLLPTGKKKELQARCEANRISTFEMRPKIVTKGWVGNS